MGRANIKAPSFKNLPEELSILAALFMSPFLEDLSIFGLNCFRN